MYNLALCFRLTESDPPDFLRNITQVAEGWRRSILARGGYWLGSFELTEKNVNREELIWWYENYLSHHLEETTFGMTSWEGLLYEMTLTLDGIQYRRTLDKEWFHNRVKILYQEAGGQAVSAWSEDTDSSDKYGQMDYIDTIGEATADEATALRDTRLANFASPKGRLIGGLEFSSKPRERVVDRLQVTVAGYVFTLNWLYRETSISATAASTAIEDLVDDSEFVVAGTIDSNTLSVDVDCSTPQRLWDAIEDIVGQGDADGDRWVGGVYAGRKFHYCQAQSVESIDYYVSDGRLMDRMGGLVVPSLVVPNTVVRCASAPTAMETFL